MNTEYIKIFLCFLILYNVRSDSLKFFRLKNIEVKLRKAYSKNKYFTSITCYFVPSVAYSIIYWLLQYLTFHLEW